jgi:hypothetical protein
LSSQQGKDVQGIIEVTMPATPVEDTRIGPDDDAKHLP